MFLRSVAYAASGLAVISLTSTPAHAGRPLITDDAGVVGEHVLQLETWLYLDAQRADHILALGVGPTEWLELSVAGVYGVTTTENPAVGAWGPIVQLKALLIEPELWPGLALVTGVGSPWGTRHLEPPGWSAYAVANTTWLVFGDVAALHANLGVNAIETDESIEPGFVAGLALAATLIGDLSAFAELYRGDVYDARNTLIAAHGGAFWSVTEHLQLDATCGTTLPFVTGADEKPAGWVTAGVKLVSGPL